MFFYEIDKFSKEPGVEKFMITEAYNFDSYDQSRFFGTVQATEATFPFNFWLLQYSIDTYADGNNWNARDVSVDVIERWLSIQEEGTVAKERDWPNFVLGNHDNSRIASRINYDFARAMAVLITTLPGTPTLYYGDEIGMTNGGTTGEDFLE